MGDDSIIGNYSRVRIFLDENFESLEKFTALGSLYLIHDSIENVKLYNFKTARYEHVEGWLTLYPRPVPQIDQLLTLQPNQLNKPPYR